MTVGAARRGTPAQRAELRAALAPAIDALARLDAWSGELRRMAVEVERTMTARLSRRRAAPRRRPAHNHKLRLTQIFAIALGLTAGDFGGSRRKKRVLRLKK